VSREASSSGLPQRAAIGPLRREQLLVIEHVAGGAPARHHQPEPTCCCRRCVWGNLNLAISALPGLMPDDLEAIPLISEDLCIVVREGNPLLARRRLRLQDLAEVPWMLLGPNLAGRRTIEGRHAEAGLPAPRLAIEVRTTATQLTILLSHSDLLSLLSESMVDGPWGAGRWRRIRTAHGFDGMPELTYRPPWNEAFFAIVPGGHPFAARRELSWKDLSDAPLIGPRPGNPVRQVLDQALAREGISFTWR
jgi:DNA-binding transcriptional LysR family regulator